MSLLPSHRGMPRVASCRLLLCVFASAFALLHFILWLRPVAPDPVTKKTPVFIDNAKEFFSEGELSRSASAKFDWETGRKRFDEYKRGVVENPSKKTFARLLKKQTECTNLVQFGNDYGHHSICNPSLIVARPRCVIYSIGVSSDVPFERAFQKYANNKCEVVLIDKKKRKTDYSSINGRFMQIESVGPQKDNPQGDNSRKKEDSKRKVIFSHTLRKNSHFSISILKFNISTPQEGLGQEIEILASTLQEIDILHLVMTLNVRPVYMAGILHTIENMGFALYSFEVDRSEAETLVTSHILIRDLREFGFSKFLGQYYTPK